MDNELFMQFDGLSGTRDTERILKRISKMPGVEFADIDPESGRLSLIGGDIDHYFVSDTIEAMGYPRVR